MGELAKTKEQLLAEVPKFVREIRTTQALDESRIEFFKKVKDWPSLEEAIDKKIEDQKEFLLWWDENVERPGRPQKNAVRRYLTVSEAEEVTGLTQQTVSKWKKQHRDLPLYKAKLFGAAWKAAMGAMADGELVQQSLSNEHYTPARYLDAARLVLGEIDIDPASCEEANKLVRAGEFFDAKMDGLRRPWRGRVWLNPPYGDLVGPFIRKLVEEREAGNAKASIVLVNAHCTDTSWFQHLWNAVLCFTDHRINFYGDETRSGSTHGSVFAYFGPDRELFLEHFRQFGACVERA